MTAICFICAWMQQLVKVVILAVAAVAYRVNVLETDLVSAQKQSGVIKCGEGPLPEKNKKKQNSDSDSTLLATSTTHEMYFLNRLKRFFGTKK